MAFNRTCFLGALLALSCAVGFAAATAPLYVSPTAVTGSFEQNVYADSDGSMTTLQAFTETCRLNFSYVSDEPISVWLSLEQQAQALLVLPSGRPCLNQTTCSASLYLDPGRRYYLLAENLLAEDARVSLNFSAAVSSPAGCGQSGAVSVPPVLTDYRYVYDDSLGPVSMTFTGAECISYLGVAYETLTYNFGGIADVDGFITTLDNYWQWAGDDYADGSAVQVPASACPSDLPYCTATVKGLAASETYVISVANGYDDVATQKLGRVKLAYTAGSQGACDTLDVVQFFSV